MAMRIYMHRHTQPCIQLLLITYNSLSLLATCFHLNGHHEALIHAFLMELLLFFLLYILVSVLYISVSSGSMNKPETSVDFQRTTRRYVSDDRNIYKHCCGNLKLYINEHW
jgi:hypothetical protein